MKGTTFVITAIERRFTALNVPMQCPFVLLIKVGWRQGNEEAKVKGSGMLAVCSRGKKVKVWTEFCVWKTAL